MEQSGASPTRHNFSDLCRNCSRPFEEHSGSALTEKNPKGWKWEKDACPIGEQPFSAELTFAGVGEVAASSLPTAPPKGDWIPYRRRELVECCGCGLKHEIEFRVEGEEPQWRWTPLAGADSPTAPLEKSEEK